MPEANPPIDPRPNVDSYAQTRKLSEVAGDLPQRGKKTWRRVLWGCGCGCLSFLLLALVAALAFWVWASATLPPLSAEMAWRPGQSAMLAVHLDPADVGVLDFVHKFATRIDRDRPDAIPQQLRGVMAQLGRKSTREVLEALVPLEMGLAYPEPPAAGTDPSVTFVSFSRHGNLFAWLAHYLCQKEEDPGRGSVQHRQVDVLPVRLGQRPKWAAVTLHSVLLAEDEEEIKGMVDRVLAGTPALGDLGVYRARLGATAEFYGILDNLDGWLASPQRWEDPPEELLAHLRVARGMAWAVDLITADSAHAAVWVRMPDAEGAGSLAALLDRHREAILRDLEAVLRDPEADPLALTVHADLSTEGEWVRLHFEASGFEKRLQDLFLGSH